MSDKERIISQLAVRDDVSIREALRLAYEAGAVECRAPAPQPDDVIERISRRLAGNLTICSQFYSEAWRAEKIREVMESELAATPQVTPELEPGEFFITRGDGVQERCRYKSITESCVVSGAQTTDDSPTEGAHSAFMGQSSLETAGQSSTQGTNEGTSEQASPTPDSEELRHAVMCMDRSCKQCNAIAKRCGEVERG